MYVLCFCRTTIFGSYAALSIMQGGPGFHFFHPMFMHTYAQEFGHQLLYLFKQFPTMSLLKVVSG